MSQGEHHESDPISLTVYDAPTGKGRPRFSTKTGKPYTPSKTRNAETHVRNAWLAAGSPRLPDGEALAAMIYLYLERPQGHWKRDGTLTKEGARSPRPHRTKPDVDNAAKLVLDALEGYAYARDVAVVSLHVAKEWCSPGKPPRTVIHVWTGPSPSVPQP